MRLIDADELYRSIRIQVNSCDEDYGRALLNIALKVSNAEGVKAIPIDFIKAFSEILLDRRERFVLETLIEVWEGKREIKVPYINQMLDDWEKENGTRNTDS